MFNSFVSTSFVSGKEQEINLTTLETRKLQCKREVFQEFLTDIYEMMDRRINLGSFKVFVTASATSAENPESSLLQEDKERIRQSQNLDDHFVVLSRYWNSQNLYILERVVRRFIGGVKGEILLLEYQKKIEQIDTIEDNIPKPELLHSVSIAWSSTELHFSERFSNIMQTVFDIFKQLQVSLNVLQVYLSVVISASSHKALAEASGFDDIFTILNCYLSWDHYSILLQIVEKFGNRKVKKLVRDYDQDFQHRNLQTPCPNTGSWHFHHAELFLSECERELLEIQTNQLCDEFANITSQSFLLLDPSSTKKFVKNLSASSRYSSLIKPFSDIATDSATLSEVFINLNHFGWNYIHYHLLECLVEKYGSSELRSSLHTYINKLSHFEETTTLAKFLWVLPRGNPPLRSNFVLMTFSLNVNFQEYTLHELSKLRTSLMSMFDLHSYALVMYTAKVSGSSFKLKFLIPSGVDCLLLMESKEKASFFRDHKISRVKLYEKGCYCFNYVINSECSPPEEMKTEAEATRNLAQKLQDFRAQIQ